MRLRTDDSRALNPCSPGWTTRSRLSESSTACGCIRKRSSSAWLVGFFFSSRRRYTRLVSDWSSDVCSSDLRFVEEKRRLLRTWNLSLVVATFALTILGTFLTRSGVVNSVHAFTQSALGPMLLGYLVAIRSEERRVGQERRCWRMGGHRSVWK